MDSPYRLSPSYGNPHMQWKCLHSLLHGIPNKLHLRELLSVGTSFYYGQSLQVAMRFGCGRIHRRSRILMLRGWDLWSNCSLQHDSQNNPSAYFRYRCHDDMLHSHWRYWHVILPICRSDCGLGNLPETTLPAYYGSSHNLRISLRSYDLDSPYR